MVAVSVDHQPFTDRRPQKSAVSRLPKHNRADPQEAALEAATRRLGFDRRSSTTRLGTKPELSLREDVVVESEQGDRRARSWAAATREWRSWLSEAQETSAVFTGVNDEGETKEITTPLENRFMESRQKQLYAKLRDLERGVRGEYGEWLTTAMLTFTASNMSGAGDWWRCPANHLDDLLGSWPAIRRALHRQLENREWEYARILEPHKSGYVHVHVAVFVRGDVPESLFAPVMDAHVRHCLPASEEAHRVEGDAVSINRDVSNVAAYLSSYLMKWGEEPLDAPEHVQRFNALLWATGTRRWSVSNGAQEYMSFEPPEHESEYVYELTHIDVGTERYPIERGGGDVLMLELDHSAAGVDPPPVR